MASKACKRCSKQAARGAVGKQVARKKRRLQKRCLQKSICKKRCLRVPPDRHPEPGFRWARAVKLWVRLTRDDHASLTIYQARAQRALVQGNIKPDAYRRQNYCRPLRPAVLGRRVKNRTGEGAGAGRHCLQQLAVRAERRVQPQHQGGELLVGWRGLFGSGCARV